MVKIGAVVLAVANAEKLPAGHPLRRLNKLVQFGKDWVETNIPQAASVRNNKWQLKWEVNGQRMAQAFERCGTYDPTSRKRRSVQRKKMSELEFGRSIERHGIKNTV